MIIKNYYTDQHGRIFGVRTSITTLYVDSKTDKIKGMKTVTSISMVPESKLELSESE